MYNYTWITPHYCRGQFNFTHGSMHIPTNAVYAGTDRNGEVLYAGRTLHGGDMIPAKIVPTQDCAFVPWGGREHVKLQFQYLQTKYAAWRPALNGDVPPEAIPFGKTRQGEFLYMGRVVHDGALTPGKVQRSHGCLYIPYNGMELMFKEYEVLILL